MKSEEREGEGRGLKGTEGKQSIRSHSLWLNHVDTCVCCCRWWFWWGRGVSGRGRGRDGDRAVEVWVLHVLEHPIRSQHTASHYIVWRQEWGFKTYVSREERGKEGGREHARFSKQHMSTIEAQSKEAQPSTKKRHTHSHHHAQTACSVNACIHTQ